MSDVEKATAASSNRSTSSPTDDKSWFPARRSIGVLVLVLIGLFIAILALEQARGWVVRCIAEECCRNDFALCPPAIAQGPIASQLPPPTPATSRNEPSASPRLTPAPSPTNESLPTATPNVSPSALTTKGPPPAYCKDADLGRPSARCVGWFTALFDPTSELMRPLFWIVHGTLLVAFALALALLVLALLLRPLNQLGDALQKFAAWLTPKGGKGEGGDADVAGTLAKMIKAFALTAIPTATFVVGYQVAKPQSITDLEAQLEGLQADVRTISRDARELEGAVQRARASAQDLLDGQVDAIRADLRPIADDLAAVKTLIEAISRGGGEGGGGNTLINTQVLTQLTDVLERLRAIETAIRDGAGGAAEREALLRMVRTLEVLVGRLPADMGGGGSAQNLKRVADELVKIRQTLEGMGG